MGGKQNVLLSRPLELVTSCITCGLYVCSLPLGFQEQTIQSYLAQADLAHYPHVFVILPDGFWQLEDSVVPTSWFDTVSSIHDSGSLVVLLTVPTDHVPHYPNKMVLSSRNDQLREWIHHSPKAITLVDFAAIAALKDAPPNTDGFNWHYQCAMLRTSGHSADTVTWVWTAHQLALDFLRTVHMSNDGHCFDEMNRSLLNYVFDAICPALQTD